MSPSPCRLFLVGLAALLMFAGPADALASKRVGRARIGRELTHALDAAKATSAQRKQVEGIVEEVERRAEAMMNGKADIDTLIDIFAQDRIDDHAVEVIKTRRETSTHKLADALTQAFCEVHDALSRDQRQQVVDYARGKAEGKNMRSFKAKLVSGLVSAQIEDTLDQLVATDEERKVAHAARDEVLAAVTELQAHQESSVAQLSSLFSSEKVDKAAINRFQTEKEADLRTLTNVIQHAIVSLHDTLSPAHRQKLVEIVRARRAHQVPHANDPEEGF
jgi:hypothetical protein